MTWLSVYECAFMCACVCFVFEQRRQRWDHSAVKMGWHWILGRSLRTQKAREECGMWKPTFRSRKKHSDIPVCIWVCSYVCPCNSFQGWMLHVGYTMYPNMLHSNSNLTLTLNFFITSDKEVLRGSTIGMSRLLTLPATKLYLPEILWSVTSGHILLWTPAVCNSFNLFLTFCFAKDLFFVPFAE